MCVFLWWTKSKIDWFGKISEHKITEYTNKLYRNTHTKWLRTNLHYIPLTYFPLNCKPVIEFFGFFMMCENNTDHNREWVRTKKQEKEKNETKNKHKDNNNVKRCVFHWTRFEFFCKFKQLYWIAKKKKIEQHGTISVCDGVGCWIFYQLETLCKAVAILWHRVWFSCAVCNINIIINTYTTTFMVVKRFSLVFHTNSIEHK